MAPPIGVRAVALLALPLVVATTSCDAGISSGIDYPDVSNVDLEGNLVTPEGDEKASVSLGKFKFAPETCTGIDLTFAKDDLDQEDLNRFFAAHNIIAKAKRARDDLWWYEIENHESLGKAFIETPLF